MRSFVIITIIIVLTSCASQGSKQKTENEKIDVHHVQTPEVTLDNGKKWKVNFAITKGISNMRQLVESINNKSSLDDYHRLGEKLLNEFNTILRRCDMTGEAHNQLHNYLVPLRGWFKTLKKGDIAECRFALTSLKEHLGKFNSYFK